LLYPALYLVPHDWVQGYYCHYPMKFSRVQGRKLSRFCGYLQKFSLQNLELWHSLTTQASNLRKFFIENHTFHQFAQVFSPESLRYMVVHTVVKLECTLTQFSGKKQDRFPYTIIMAVSKTQCYAGCAGVYKPSLGWSVAGYCQD